MFYYYGRKKQIASYYPTPTHDIIIEPFAGAAAYSLEGRNWEKQVILIEKDPAIVGLWQYLLQASVGDIAALPEVREGDLLSSFNLSEPERLLLSLHVRPGATSVRNKVGRFSRWGAGKKYILDNLHKVKHWRVLQGEYSDAPDIKATWFIDPPYRAAGKHYTFGSSGIDYEALGGWVRNRQGQVIACEGPNHGGYLPFVDLGHSVNNGGMNLSKRSKEFVYLK